MNRSYHLSWSVFRLACPPVPINGCGVTVLGTTSAFFPVKSKHMPQSHHFEPMLMMADARTDVGVRCDLIRLCLELEF